MKALSIKAKITVVSAIAVCIIGFVAIENYLTLKSMNGLAADAQTADVLMRQHLDGDMMHDAIRADVLSQLPLQKIDRTFFFETSMLSHLYIIGAVVKEVPMPARYAGETSSLSIGRVMRQFPGKLLWSLTRRIALRNFVYDFNLESLDLAAGVPLLLFGVVFGAMKWIWYASHHLLAPTGTIMLAALSVMLGMQLLLAAAQLDLEAVPRDPINAGAIEVPSREESDVAAPR